MTEDDLSGDVSVWKCSDLDCREQWASRTEAAECPFCGCGRGRAAGFTLQEVRAAAETYGFLEDLPLHLAEPAFELVKLATIPRHKWIGLPVFHPLINWLRYDVGVVVEVYPDPDIQGEYQCRFVCSSVGGISMLHYAASHLWIPASLAGHLQLLRQE
jgi:hypothetical protein